MDIMRPLAALLIATVLAGCAEFQACPAGATAMTRTELLFGRDRMGGAPVSDAGWQDFVVREITPRFPNGITVFDASGQWRSADGTTLREASKIVMVLAAPGVETRANLNAIAEAYKVRFHQESVGIVSEPACAQF